MRYIVIILLFLAVVIAGIVYFNQHPFNINDNKTESRVNTINYEIPYESECDEDGSAVSEEVRILNRLKNRILFPKPSDFDNQVTIQKLIETGDDRNRWNDVKAARIKGYVSDVKPGGIETCNCKNKNIDERDTHIELIINPNDNHQTKRVIIEVTPRIRKLMKANHINWSTRALRDDYLGRFVEVEGWLMFDKEHETQAENTNPKSNHNWRATAWEIHPITKITTLEKNPNLVK